MKQSHAHSFITKCFVRVNLQCFLAELQQRDSNTKIEFSIKKAITLEDPHLICQSQTAEASF